MINIVRDVEQTYDTLRGSLKRQCSSSKEIALEVGSEDGNRVGDNVQQRYSWEKSMEIGRHWWGRWICLHLSCACKFLISLVCKLEKIWIDFGNIFMEEREYIFAKCQSFAKYHFRYFVDIMILVIDIILNPMSQILSLPLSYNWRNWGSERQNNLRSLARVFGYRPSAHATRGISDSVAFCM